ncbi:MAG: MFS transporter, partial [Alphaproteobacteria bacterium]|nr:MFS transporter [Alphaproteobacteria bacterium]
AMAASTAGAALVARSLPPLRPTPQRPAAAPWRTPGARPVFALALALGLCIGIFESALPARMEQLGMAAAGAGPLLAFMALGSGIGGLITSAHAEHLENPRRPAALLMTLFAVLLAPLPFLASLPLLALALAVAGVPIAPLNALGALRLQRRVPPGRQAEGFAVYIAAILVGAG